MADAVQRRTGAVELLWDLVFAFAVTQVTTLLSNGLSWAGLARSMLVLALLWWAWSAFVWAANADDANSMTMQSVLVVGTVLIFICGLVLPHAFADGALLFAISYVAVRLLHLVSYVDTARRQKASLAAIAGFAPTVGIGALLLIGGALLNGWQRAALWAVAVVIDYAGPVLTRNRLRGIQRVDFTHFTDRYSSFIIICLGESVASGGFAASGRLDSRLVVATLGLLVTIFLWWTYFRRFASGAEARLREKSEPVLAASDAYSYLHLLLVAGIIIFAVGTRFDVAGLDKPLPAGALLALCDGVALYLVGLVLVRLRLEGGVGYAKIVATAALVALSVLGTALPAWLVTCCVAATLLVLSGSEIAFERAVRRRAMAA